MIETRPFRLGVNYWPAAHAMGFWRHWDKNELEEDFAHMKGAGLDCVRLFLTWEDFQPSPETIDAKMLDLLQETLDAAADAGLEVMPTLFTGHMSGANFLPGWAVQSAPTRGRFPLVSGGRVISATPLNWYADPPVRAARIRLASACAARVSGHSALLAWDLGNENSNCTVPGSKEHAVAWLQAITEGMRAKDAKTPITIGIHMEDLEEDRHLGPREAALACDFLTMHGYPGYASFTRGPTDERLLPFLTQLTRYLGGGKEVFFSEFGVPTVPAPEAQAQLAETQSKDGPVLVSEADAAHYVRRGLDALHEAGASGAMLWCHADYSPALFLQPPFNRAPHERSFGMFRANGADKPVVHEVRSFSREGRTIATAPRVSEASFIDLSCDEYYDWPRQHLPRLFQKYCACLEHISQPGGM